MAIIVLNQVDDLGVICLKMVEINPFLNLNTSHTRGCFYYLFFG